MAWSENLEDVRTNLSPREFRIIQFALDQDYLIEWGKISEFAGYIIADFKFLDMEFEIQEAFELTTSLMRKDKQ